MAGEVFQERNAEQNVGGGYRDQRTRQATSFIGDYSPCMVEDREGPEHLGR